jgi:hypothetical protein
VTIPPPTSTASPATAAALSAGGHAPSADGNAPSAGGNALGAELFRQAMSRHAAGVVIVTLAGPSGPSGLTVTSFSSASLDPPLVSFYIGHGSSNWPAIRDARHFAVNLIGEGHQSLAHRFALKGEDRFAPPTRWSRGPKDLPLLSDATTHLIAQRSPWSLSVITNWWSASSSTPRSAGETARYCTTRAGSPDPRHADSACRGGNRRSQPPICRRWRTRLSRRRCDGSSMR